MTQTAHLWLFFLMVFGVVLLPGLDMAFVLASSLVGGRRAGLSAVGGIVLGAVFHVVAAVTGMALLLQLLPGAYDALLWAGALYVAWLGASLLRGGAALAAAAPGGARSPAATFRQGALTNLLNPKAYVFMLAVFPQFLRPEYGPLWLQALVLWALIALAQVTVYGGLALAADRSRGWLGAHPAANAAAARAVGGLLVLAAALTALDGLRSP